MMPQVGVKRGGRLWGYEWMMSRAVVMRYVRGQAAGKGALALRVEQGSENATGVCQQRG